MSYNVKVDTSGEGNRDDLVLGERSIDEGADSNTSTALTITVASTFACEPILEPLKFWLGVLDSRASVRLAPYAQVLQMLLSPDSIVSSNQSGTNILLIRLEDWIRDRGTETVADNLTHIRRVAEEFVAALEMMRRRTAGPLLLYFCPVFASAPVEYQKEIENAQQRIMAALRSMPGVHCWTHGDLTQLYPVDVHEDERADRIAHIPYTNEYFAAIATLLARRLAAIVKPRPKVIVVDCDNTLWKGICGEDGPRGIAITRGHLALQRMLVKQYESGVLICICSKNNPSDVDAVFDAHRDMPLRREHVIGWRVSWDPKSEGVISLAKELDLSLDSFVFIDDNPVECEEVGTSCPSVLTLRVPGSDGDLEYFTKHAWVFDQTGVSEEGKRRTQQYVENRNRAKARDNAASLGSFLASLDLVVDISPMRETEIDRVAELLQRTNQFNLTTIRRTAADLGRLWRSNDLECMTARVRDRFGDYGLVGAVLFKREPEVLRVDTFVLSCRALGRGVEHRIVNSLGAIARREGLGAIRLRYRKTARNEPAWRFLEDMFGQYRELTDRDTGVEDMLFLVPADRAEALQVLQQYETSTIQESESMARKEVDGDRRSDRWHEIAYRLSNPVEVLKEIKTSLRVREDEAEGDFVAPRTPTETVVAGIWSEMLGRSEVSVRTRFFDAGGDSLLAVQVIARIASVLRVEMSLSDFLSEPSIEKMAERLDRSQQMDTDRDGLPERIPPDCERITPEMLGSLDLDQTQIDAIVGVAPGGIKNIKDIYPLSALQEGMLFQHLLNRESDMNVLSLLLEFETKEVIGEFARALQSVVDRHEILRTGIVWEGLVRPLHIAYRKAVLPVEQLVLEGSSSSVPEQLRWHMEHGRSGFDLTAAPLIRLLIGSRADEARAFAVLKVHHIICDHQSIRMILDEAISALRGRKPEVTTVGTYRSFVEAANKEGQTDAEAFFRARLADLSEITAPFGLRDSRYGQQQIAQSRQSLPMPVAQELRMQCRRLGESAARILHAAWALVLAKISLTDDVVFGTVVLVPQAAAVLEHGSTVGLFVNTLPIRVTLRNVNVKSLVERTSREIAELLNHSHLPMSLARRCCGVSGSEPIVTSLLNYRHGAADILVGSDSSTAVRILDKVEPWAGYPITLTIDDDGQHIAFSMRTDGRIDPSRLAEYFQHAVQSLVHALGHAPRMPAMTLAILGEAEQRRVLESFNATSVRIASDKTIHEMFEEQVRRSPNAVAVSYGEESINYSELNERANQLARYLCARGLLTEQLVAVCLDRRVDLVIALLGVLKAGGAYVPLDPSNPGLRLRHLLADAQPAFVLTLEYLRPVLDGVSGEIIALDLDWERISQQRTENIAALSRGLSASNLAYVIYTSGSTGTPKGVMVEHRNLVNYAMHALTNFDVASGNGSLACSSISFDLVITGLYPVLLAGKTVRLCREENGLPLIANEIGTVTKLAPLKLTPSHLALMNGPLRKGVLKDRVATLVLGGEKLPASAVRAWKEFAPSTRVFNHYGPTETTVGCIAGEVGDALTDPIPLGRPLSNTQIRILDAYRQLVPIGALGEIYVGGAGVARGYMNLPGLTAEKFVTDPFAADTAARLYRTGDLGRWRDDGTIEYAGRNDDQIKIRGHRVELGEVEARIAAIPHIKDIAVVAREEGGETRLVAYVVLAADKDTDAAKLRELVGISLPDYMVPSSFVVLDRLPLTQNGKVDRAALPATDKGTSGREYVAPIGALEETVAEIWQTLLQLNRVGRSDNFFELGGHSLHIVQMIERLANLGLTAEARYIFENPVLSDLAAGLRQASRELKQDSSRQIPPGCTEITADMLRPLLDFGAEHIETIVRSVPGGAVNIQDVYPLTPLQDGILFHHRLLSERAGDMYAGVRVLRVPSRARLDHLVAALQSVANRHDILRTAVLWEHLPEPVQVVYRTVKVDLEILEWNREADQEEQIREWIKPERQRLNLTRAPLIRLSAGEGAAGEWYAFLKAHHVVMDHMALGVVLDEMLAHLDGREVELPQPEPYRNHVLRTLEQAKSLAAEAYFQEKLTGIDEPTAPFGVLDVLGDGSRIRDTYTMVEHPTAAMIRSLARRLGTSAATLFHAVWALVVAHTSGREDVVFGSVFMGRMHGVRDYARALGISINTLPVRIDLRGLSTAQLVEYTHRELVGLLDHEQASLAVAQRCSSITPPAPLFTALLNYRHSSSTLEEQWSRGDIRAQHVEGRTNYPLTMSVDDLGERFGLTIQADARIDADRVNGYVRECMLSLLETMDRAPTMAALSLNVVPREELARLRQFNATAGALPKYPLVHRSFEACAKKSPDAVALRHNTRTLSYASLNRRSNQLARQLRAMGVSEESLVGVCLERGPDMIVGLLAILKAGAAYVPLDPSYPSDRLQYMLQDSKPKVLITQQGLKSLLPHTEATILVMEEKAREIDARTGTDLSLAEAGLTPSNMVYVIYTSGSTGRPKGIAMSHGAMVNLIEWHRRELPVKEEMRVLQYAALSFDVAFQEIFTTLSMGGTLVLLDERTRRDARELAGFLKKEAMERVFMPPVMLQALAEWYVSAGEAPPQCLRDVITAGEQLHITTQVRSLFRHVSSCRLHNHYGPTETHVVTSLTLIGDPESWPLLPGIGRPISNTQLYVLDSQRCPAPLGVAGEIYIGGSNLARGYLHQPSLTSERFVIDPFCEARTTRLYRTGDMGRWTNDGVLEYLGRNDDQTKIRGHRVELREIESQILKMPEVKDAAVVAKDDETGDRKLVSYLVLRDVAVTDVESLRTHLRSLLPEYMVPKAIVLLREFPLTPSGKLDRKALPPPDFASLTIQDYEAPQGDIEQTVARIWGELLHLERIGRRDNFFDLGGHSLLATRVVTRISHVLDIDLPLHSLFEWPTLEELSRGILEQMPIAENLEAS